MHQYRYLYRNRISACFCIFLRNVNSKLLFRASPNPFSDKEIFIIFESFRVKFQISLNTRENITWSTISHVIMVWSWSIVKMILIWQIWTSDFWIFRSLIEPDFDLPAWSCDRTVPIKILNFLLKFRLNFNHKL